MFWGDGGLSGKGFGGREIMKVGAEGEVAAEVSLGGFEAVFWEVVGECGGAGVDFRVGGLLLGGLVVGC